MGLGLLAIVVTIFFKQGLWGWLQQRWGWSLFPAPAGSSHRRHRLHLFAINKVPHAQHR